MAQGRALATARPPADLPLVVTSSAHVSVRLYTEGVPSYSPGLLALRATLGPGHTGGYVWPTPKGLRPFPEMDATPLG